MVLYPHIQRIADDMRTQGLRRLTHKEEMHYLYKLAGDMSMLWRHPASFLELGTYQGGTSLALVEGVKAMKRDHRISITTVDNYSRDVQYEELKQKLAELGYTEDILNLVKADGFEFLSSVPDNSVAMLYIDFSHKYQPMKQVLSIAISKMFPGGLICGHDYCVVEPGVIRAVDEWREDNKERLLGFGTFWRIWWTVRK